MTTPTFWSALVRPERPRSGGRGTWFTVLGLMLVPLVVGGLLTWALWQPTERLDRITAAVVNDDEPVTVDGQVVPLGRQLAAGLVTSSGTETSPVSASGVADVSGHASTTNLTWEITDDADATQGLASGRYAAVVVIPKNFSAAATSWATPGATSVEQARIIVRTSERSRPLDSVIAGAVTQTASQTLGITLTQTYVDNVLTGFATMGDELGQAADGADQLASGTEALADGADQLADGASQLASGTGALTVGTGALVTGSSALAAAMRQLASGVGGLSAGMSSLAFGLQQLAAEASAGAAATQAGLPAAQTFAAGLDQLAVAVNGTSPSDPNSLAYAASNVAVGTSGVATTLSQLTTGGSSLAELCLGGDLPSCQALAGGVTALSATANQVAGGAAALDAAVSTGVGGAPPLTTSTTQLAAGGHEIVDGLVASAAGTQTLAAYLQESADGAAALAAGAGQTGSGAGQLATGAQATAGGIIQLFNGINELAGGAGGVADGANQLAEGVTELTPGTRTLADGLRTATGAIPAHTPDEAARLASVIAAPVTAQGTSSDIFGSSVVPYFMVLAMWLGGLATYLVLTPMTPRALGSTQPSWRLALRSLAPGALVGVVQGLGLTIILAPPLGLGAGDWLKVAVVAVVVGVAFAAVNQGLAAAFRGVGRFVAALVATVALAAAVVSTIPSLVENVYAGSPLGPALAALQGTMFGGALFGPVALLVFWTLGGLALTTAALARHRVVPARTLARWARAA
ncbi:MAG: hypothetical protein FWD18_00200 [Micrococcales bacterium]|nr:hypothetical protein [Micrococcales bacterium]